MCVCGLHFSLVSYQNLERSDNNIHFFIFTLSTFLLWRLYYLIFSVQIIIYYANNGVYMSRNEMKECRLENRVLVSLLKIQI